MITQHIAVVPEGTDADFSELARVSAALQQQVSRDVAPLWGVTATVDLFQALEDVPVGYWPIVVCRDVLGRQAGVHLDRNGQPYAHITMGPWWSLDASRACLEMIINPYGDRTTSGPSPRSDQGVVEYLVEVSGPCASRAHAYPINGVLVADFCTPAYYGAATVGVPRSQVSFNGSLRRAFQLLPGGYVTWHDAVSNGWWMRTLQGTVPHDVSLGSIVHPLMSARALAQLRGPARGYGESGGGRSLALVENQHRLQAQAVEASLRRAMRLRSLLGQRLQETLTERSFAAYERAGLELPEGAELWETEVMGPADVHADELSEALSVRTGRGREPRQLAWPEAVHDDDAATTLHATSRLLQNEGTPVSPVSALSTTSSVPPPLPSARTSAATPVSPRPEIAPPAACPDPTPSAAPAIEAEPSAAKPAGEASPSRAIPSLLPAPSEARRPSLAVAAAALLGLGVLGALAMRAGAPTRTVQSEPRAAVAAPAQPSVAADTNGAAQAEQAAASAPPASPVAASSPAAAPRTAAPAAERPRAPAPPAAAPPSPGSAASKRTWHRPAQTTAAASGPSAPVAPQPVAPATETAQRLAPPPAAAIAQASAPTAVTQAVAAVPQPAPVTAPAARPAARVGDADLDALIESRR